MIFLNGLLSSGKLSNDFSRVDILSIKKSGFKFIRMDMKLLPSGERLILSSSNLLITVEDTPAAKINVFFGINFFPYSLGILVLMTVTVLSMV